MTNPSVALPISPFSPTNMNTNYKRIVNNSVPKFINGYRFNFPLKLSDFDVIKSNESNFVNFTPTTSPQDGHLGWVEELEYELQSGMTEFNLLTQ